MLSCHINISVSPDELYECKECKKCTPESALNYPFDKDLENSQDLVNELKFLIESNTILKCRDTEENKNPDLLVIDISINNFLLCRVEAKYLEGKAFVKSEEYIGLKPKEVLVIDEPKLKHYFECKKSDKLRFKREVPLFVVWKFDRPCEDIGGITVFQEIDKLQEIHTKERKRYFRRKKATNDYVDGERKGIIDKYHYSIKETEPIWKLVPKIFDIAEKYNLCELRTPTLISSPKGIYKDIDVREVENEHLKILATKENDYQDEAKTELKRRNGELS